MAVELNYSKKLHKHTMPIIMLGIAGLILSLVLFGYYGREYPGEAAHDALLNRTLQLSPTRNGLAHASTTIPQPAPLPDQNLSKPLHGVSGTLGEVTKLTLSLPSAATSK